MKKGWKDALITTLLLGNLYTANAGIVWPLDTDWTALRNGSDFCIDERGDQHPAAVDLIGARNTFSAGYWAFVKNGHTSGDIANDAFMFRMRVGGKNGNYVWQAHLDTDGDASSIDWILQLVNSGRSESRGVVLVETASGGTTLADINTGRNPASWQGCRNRYSRWSPIAGSRDFHVDLAIPWNDFASITGVEEIEQIRTVLSTSTTHTHINKDVLTKADLSDQISNVLSENIPEPASVPLLLSAAGGMVAFKRIFW